MEWHYREVVFPRRSEKMTDEEKIQSELRRVDAQRAADCWHGAALCSSWDSKTALNVGAAARKALADAELKPGSVAWASAQAKAGVWVSVEDSSMPVRWNAGPGYFEYRANGKWQQSYGLVNGYYDGHWRLHPVQPDDPMDAEAFLKQTFGEQKFTDHEKKQALAEWAGALKVGSADWAEEQLRAGQRLTMAHYPKGDWLYLDKMGRVMLHFADGREGYYSSLSTLAAEGFVLYQEGPPDEKSIVGLKFLKEDGGGIASQEWLARKGAERFIYKPENEWLEVPGEGAYVGIGRGGTDGQGSLLSYKVDDLDYAKLRLAFVEGKGCNTPWLMAPRGVECYKWVRILPEPCPERLPRDLVEWIRDCEHARDRLSPEQQAMVLGEGCEGSFWWARKLAREGEPVMHQCWGITQACFPDWDASLTTGWARVPVPELRKVPTDVVWVTEGAKHNKLTDFGSGSISSHTIDALFNECAVISAPQDGAGKESILFEAIAFRRAESVGVMFVCWPKEMNGEKFEITKTCKIMFYRPGKGYAPSWDNVTFQQLVVRLKKIAKEIEDKYQRRSA